MDCSLPAPWFYRFVMHNVHFISTPVYIITLIALFRETSTLFQTYKYYIIAHVITNLTSEFYVTFLWLPMTYLPYDVYRTTGWLSEWGVSGILQFYIIAQFVIVIGLSVLEMFHHRFKVVVMHREDKLSFKLPSFGLYVFRVLALVHIITITWSTLDGQTMVYQQTKKDALFKKVADLPKELGCYSVFILAPEDPILMINCALYGILLCLGSYIILSTVFFIFQFLSVARNISKETKKLQKMLIFSLLIQGTIHIAMIIIPVSAQIYEMIFIVYNNDFAIGLLFCVAYHGFFSTCAMIVFTKQLRQNVIRLVKCCSKQDVVPIIRGSQLGGPSTLAETSVR